MAGNRGAGEENGSAAGDPSRWKKSALIIIGMQNDYIDESSPYCFKGAAAIVPAVKKAVSFAREKGALIVWAKREHHKSGRDVELFRRHKYGGESPGAVIKGTRGAALIDDLEPQPEDQVVVKYRFSAFFGTNLHLALQAAGIQTVIVIGIQTANCIRHTVFDAVELDYPSIVVISDATLSKSPEIQQANLLDMRNVRIATPSLAEWMSHK